MDKYESEYAWDGASDVGDRRSGLMPNVEDSGLSVKHLAMKTRREVQRNSDGSMDADPDWRGGRGPSGVQPE